MHDAVEQTPKPWEFSREIHRLPESRRQLVFRVRREIAEGTYDDPAKLDKALDRLLERVLDLD
ncbi:MAG: hypothetical protein ACRDD1_13505 [Planctomycetia bacterium]